MIVGQEESANRATGRHLKVPFVDLSLKADRTERSNEQPASSAVRGGKGERHAVQISVMRGHVQRQHVGESVDGRRSACDRYGRIEPVSCADTEELAEARESREKFVGGLVCAGDGGQGVSAKVFLLQRMHRITK